MSTPKISKIVIEIPGLDKPLELTHDQAKALKVLLDTIVPAPFTPNPFPIVIDRPVYLPAPPHWYSAPNTGTPPPWKQWEITCVSNSAGGDIVANASFTSGAQAQ